MPDEPDFETDLDPGERALGERLQRSRPVPAAGFRGALGRRLAERDPGYGPRPQWLVPVASGCFGGGLVLIALAALIAG
jgi:hypothetical protein